MPDKLEVVKAAADVIREDLTRALGSRIGNTVGADEIEAAREVMEGVLRGHLEILFPGPTMVTSYSRIDSDKLEILLKFEGNLPVCITPDAEDAPVTAASDDDAPEVVKKDADGGPQRGCSQQGG
jgi:hypothetical protein